MPAYSTAFPPAKTVTNSVVNAAVNVTVTLPGAAGLTTYVEGFDITGTGATGALVVNVNLSGPTNPLFYTLIAAPNINATLTPLSVRFPSPVPASAQNTSISLLVPNLGSGNSNVAATLYGFLA